MQNMNTNTLAIASVLMNRSQYLTFVAEWKSQYRALSEAQRQLKRQIREAQIEQRGDDVSLLTLRSNAGRKSANVMLVCRAEMKIAAQASYRASRALQGIGACLL